MNKGDLVKVITDFHSGLEKLSDLNAEYLRRFNSEYNQLRRERDDSITFFFLMVMTTALTAGFALPAEIYAPALGVFACATLISLFFAGKALRAYLKGPQVKWDHPDPADPVAIWRARGGEKTYHFWQNVHVNQTMLVLSEGEKFGGTTFHLCHHPKTGTQGYYPVHCLKLLDN